MIGFVTDSTSYLPAEYLASNDILVVPVQVILDGVAYDEVTGISVEQVTSAMLADASVTTSRPAPENFVAAYQELIDKGVKQIVSLHLSSELSGTYESALIASQKVDADIRVIDSRGVGMTMGFALESGVLAAKGGEGLDDVEQIMRDRCAESLFVLYVDTLEFLRRGGRISSLRSRIGGALAVKPLLHMHNGSLEQYELVRTTTKALQRLIDIAVEHGNGGNVDIAVHHVNALERAALVADAIKVSLGIPYVSINGTGAVVAAHVGPGAVAIVVSPRGLHE